MKVVGKINIEVWDGDPENPQSALKQSLEEYNDVHPDLINSWKRENYEEDYLEGKWKSGSWYTNSSGVNGVFYDSSYLECRFGIVDDMEKVSKTNTTGYEAKDHITNTPNSSTINKAGINPSLGYGYMHLYEYQLPTRRFIDMDYFPDSPFGPISAEILKNAKHIPRTSAVLPIKNKASLPITYGFSIVNQFVPAGIDYTIYNLGLYRCFTNNEYRSHINRTKNNTAQGITFHKFSTPLNVAATDYVKISYTITFVHSLMLNSFEQITYTDKDGIDHEAVRFPVIFISSGDYNRLYRDIQFLADPVDKPRSPMELVWSTAPSNFIAQITGISLNGGTTLAAIKNSAATQQYSEVSKMLPKELVDLVEPYKDYDNINFYEHFKRQLIDTKDIEYNNILPFIVTNSSLNLSNGSYNSTFSSQGSLIGKFSGLGEPRKMSLNLPAAPEADHNGKYFALYEAVLTTSMFTFYSSSIGYLTILSSPLIKTKFDKLSVSTNVSLDGLQTTEFPYVKSQSGSEEKE